MEDAIITFQLVEAMSTMPDGDVCGIAYCLRQRYNDHEYCGMWVIRAYVRRAALYAYW